MSIEILKLSHEGRGIGQIEGKTVFLEGGLPGEQVEFAYDRKKSRFSEGRVTKVLAGFSPHRVPPLCPYSETCGGCSLHHISSDFQVEHKQKVLLEHLEYIGRVKPLELLPPLRGPQTGYRRKARLGVRYVQKKQKLLIGFREKNGRYLAEMDHCPILDERVGMKLAVINDLIMSLEHYTQIPQIEVAAGDETVALVFRHLIPLTPDEETKLANFGKNHQFQIYLHNNDNQIHLLYPQTHEKNLSYRLPDYNLEFQFEPLDFVQVNSAVNQKMVRKAIELLAPKPHEVILDLFCGLGNFSLPLARQGCQVHAVEGSVEMVRRGSMNARLNGLDNVYFYSANLEGELEGQKWMSQVYNKVLLDPPRTGALNMVRQMNRFKPQQIVYISCNSSTLARDAQVLVEQGYTLTQAGIIDMFPHTQHMECIASFEVSA